MYKLLIWFGSCVFAIALLVPAQGKTFQYVYDETGQLVKAIDSTGTGSEYVYDGVGNMLEIKRSTVSGLIIINFIPSQGVDFNRVHKHHL